MDIGLIVNSVYSLFEEVLSVSFSIYGVSVTIGGLLLFSFVVFGICILMERMGF